MKPSHPTWSAIRDSVWKLNHGLAIVAGWLVLLITLIACYGVFTRYVLGAPDTWSFPVSAYLLCLVVFFAASHALQEGIHVRIDLLKEWFPGRVARWAATVADLITIGFLGLFFYQVWKIFHEAYTLGRIDETELAWPVAFVQWTLPLGAGLMLITQALLIGARWIDGHEVAQRDSW